MGIFATDWLKAFFVSLALTGGTVSALGAQTSQQPASQQPSGDVELTLPQARSAGFGLLANGQFAQARLLALDLLKINADDGDAYIILARAEGGLGRFEPALDAGRAGWRAAKTPEQEYFSAIVTAQAFYAKGAPLRAQFWLRRATQVAPSPELRAQAVQFFGRVKQNTPIDINLSFSLTPSSNVNNGTNNTQTNGGGGCA